MIDTLVYYYRVVQLQVADTYLVGLSLLVLAGELFIAVREAKALPNPAAGSEGADSDIAGSGQTYAMGLRLVLWSIMLTPLGIIVSKLLFGGDLNNPVAFALVPAGASAAYGAAIVWEHRRSAVTLIAAAIIMAIAAGQQAGLSMPPVTRDPYGRDAELREVEAIIEGEDIAYSAEEPLVILVTADVAGRLAEYRDDCVIYIYEDWIREPVTLESGLIVTSLGTGVMICSYEEAESGIVNGIEGCRWIGQTDRYVVFCVPPV